MNEINLAMHATGGGYVRTHTRDRPKIRILSFGDPGKSRGVMMPSWQPKSLGCIESNDL